jgi:ankyrin repeat protein
MIARKRNEYPRKVWDMNDVAGLIAARKAAHRETLAIHEGDMTDEAFNAFHRSIKRGDLAVIRNALTGGVSANLENKFGWTLLMLAASEGDTAIGELLVSNGEDMNKATNTGQTAMSLAIIESWEARPWRDQGCR